MLTPDQLRDVADVLRGGSLTRRPVLVPLTRLAFRPGRLTPDHRIDQEVVEIRRRSSSSRNEYQQITVQEAIQSLEDERKALMGPSKKKTSITSRQSTDPSAKKEAPAAKPTFFDIREEYDESGKQISAERINVAQMLQAAAQQESETAHYGQNEPDMIIKDQGALGGKPLSDDAYDQLSQRLDELARLEEEEASALKKRTSKKGWNKGFLNTKKPASIKKKPPAPESTAATIKAAPKPATAPAAASDSVASRRRVGFSNQPDQVQEIPRVGQWSVQEMPKPSQTTISQTVLADQVAERQRRGRPKAAPSAPSGTTPRVSRFKQERRDNENAKKMI